MKNLVFAVLLIIGVPQLTVQLFFAFFAFAIHSLAPLGPAYDVGWRAASVVVSGIVLAITLIVAMVGLFAADDGWWPEYVREQEHLRREEEKERQRIRAEIDKHVGVPRIG